MREEKFHIYLNDDEYSRVIQTLIRLKNSLISQGRYTDGVDDVLCKVLSTKKRKLKISLILQHGSSGVMRDGASRQTAANPRGQERRKVVLMGAAAPTDGKRVLSAAGSPEGSRPFGKVSPQGRWEFPQKLPYLV